MEVLSVLLAFLLIVYGIWETFDPVTAWWLRLPKWEFRYVEPSDEAFRMIRIEGIFMAILGFVILALLVFQKG